MRCIRLVHSHKLDSELGLHNSCLLLTSQLLPIFSQLCLINVTQLEVDMTTTVSIIVTVNSVMTSVGPGVDTVTILTIYHFHHFNRFTILTVTAHGSVAGLRNTGTKL